MTAVKIVMVFLSWSQASFRPLLAHQSLRPVQTRMALARL